LNETTFHVDVWHDDSSLTLCGWNSQIEVRGQSSRPREKNAAKARLAHSYCARQRTLTRVNARQRPLTH